MRGVGATGGVWDVMFGHEYDSFLPGKLGGITFIPHACGESMPMPTSPGGGVALPRRTQTKNLRLEPHLRIVPDRGNRCDHSPQNVCENAGRCTYKCAPRILTSAWPSYCRKTSDFLCGEEAQILARPLPPSMPYAAGADDPAKRLESGG